MDAKIIICGWILFCLFGSGVARGISNVTNQWKQTTFYGAAMNDSSSYNVSITNTLCQCRMRCAVDPKCFSVSIVRSSSSSTFECRSSTIPLIMETTFVGFENAITFYKIAAQRPFYPTKKGIFYWPQITPLRKVEAKLLCREKGGRLTIAKTPHEMIAAVAAALYASNTFGISLLFIDLERTSTSNPHKWGDNTTFDVMNLPPGVLADYNNKNGMGIKIVSPTQFTIKEMDPLTANAFICQYDPLGINW